MRKLALALVGAGLLAGCVPLPFEVETDPIRYLDSPADVSACQRLGSVGEPVRTDGRGPFRYDRLTQVVRVTPGAPVAGVASVPVEAGNNLAERLNGMRDAALAMGATDLLLQRRHYRDWSYVEGIAYRCRV